MSHLIQPAHAADYAEVLALLRALNLPPEGVPEHFPHFLVARDEDDNLVGCVGLEPHGATALLRSLAVKPAQQGHGLGRALTLAALSAARARQAHEVVLLTTTAADFFQRHFGFEPVERAAYDGALAASREWNLPRCAAAVCLRLRSA